MTHLGRLALLLLLVTSWAFAQSDPAEVVNRLRTAPTEADATLAAEFIARGTAAEWAKDLEGALRGLLASSSEKRTMCLRALSRWAVPELELDLIGLLPAANNAVPEGFDDLMAAFAKSGTGAGKATLRGLVETFQGALFTAPETRRKIWRAMFSLDPAAALFSAMRLSRFVGPFDDPAADFLISLVEQTRQQRDLLPRAIPAFYTFLGSPGRIFPPPANPRLPSFGVNSPVYRVQKSIAETLRMMGSPLALELLLVYADSDAPDLAQLSQSADYSAVEAAPWLLPSGSFVLTPFGEVPGKAGVTLRRFKVGVPRDLPFIPEQKFNALFQYEKKAIAAGMAQPSVTPKTTQQLYAQTVSLMKSVVQRIASAYNLPMTPVLPPDPGNAPPENVFAPTGMASRFGALWRSTSGPGGRLGKACRALRYRSRCAAKRSHF